MELFFDNCTVEVWPDNGFTKTVFDDETFVPAYPQYENEAYLWTSRELGYAENVKEMCIHHEILHTFLCEACGLAYSPTLWAVAHQFAEGTIPEYLQYEEEATVLSFQKFLNNKAIDPILEEFKSKNRLSLRELKKEAKTLLGFTIT